MSESWYLIPSKPTYLSGYEKENFDNYAIDGIQEILDVDSPISSGVQLINADLTTISEIRAVIQNNTVDGIEKSDERQIIVNIGTLKCGDYVKFENDIWMISSFVGNNKFYEKGIMIYCNHILKFQSPTGTILSYPCITESTNSVGINESDVLTTLSGIIHMKVPFDSNTVLLREDRRLFVDKDTVNPRSFAITKADTVTYNYGDKGLIELTLKQCVSGEPDDNIELGICNYVAPVVVPEPPVGLTYAEILCSNPSNEIKLGSSILRTLTPSFFESTGILSTNTIIAVWDFEYPIGFENQFTITQVVNQIKIKVANNYDLLGKTIKCNVMSSNGGYGGSIILSIII